jgi:hypothetical protein
MTRMRVKLTCLGLEHLLQIRVFEASIPSLSLAAEVRGFIWNFNLDGAVD